MSQYNPKAAIELKENVRRMKALNARYRRPICKNLNLEHMQQDVQEMQESIYDVLSKDEQEMEDILGYDDWMEMKASFDDLDGSLYELMQSFEDHNYRTLTTEETFDQWMVALQTDSNGFFGYDSYEDDWFDLSEFESRLAVEYEGKQLERLTKKELIASARECIGIVLRYIGIRYRFNDLKATIDIIIGDQAGITAAMDRINELYEEWFDEDGKPIPNYKHEHRHEWNNLLDMLPDRVWIE